MGKLSVSGFMVFFDDEMGIVDPQVLAWPEHAGPDGILEGTSRGEGGTLFLTRAAARRAIARTRDYCRYHHPDWEDWKLMKVRVVRRAPAEADI